MRLSGALFFSAGLALVAACAVSMAFAWPAKAAMFPLTMGIPLLVLALVQVVLDLREPPARADQALANRRSSAVFGWMAGFIALVMLLSFPFAVPIFVFCYLAFASRERWLLAAVLAAAAWGAFHLLFQRLLHFPFETGLITGWFQ